jgi:hypothetical protein
MDAETELHHLMLILSELATWGEHHLDNEAADRQYIAEHLTGCLAAIVCGDPLPRDPF